MNTGRGQLNFCRWDDIQKLIERFNARIATRAEREKLTELLQSGVYDDIVGNALYQQLLRELENFDDDEISADEHRAARPLFEQSRTSVIRARSKLRRQRLYQVAAVAMACRGSVDACSRHGVISIRTASCGALHNNTSLC